MFRIYLILLFLFFTHSNFAQITVPADQDIAFAAGDFIISPSVSFAYYQKERFPHSHRNGNRIPFALYLDYGLNQYISIGVFGGWNARFYKYDFPGSSNLEETLFTVNHYVVGTRYSFHFLPLVEDAFNRDLLSSKVDMYVSILAGAQISNFNNIEFETQRRLLGGATLGVRYYVYRGFGIFAEGGLGIFGFGNVGLNFRL